MEEFAVSFTLKLETDATGLTLLAICCVKLFAKTCSLIVANGLKLEGQQALSKISDVLWRSEMVRNADILCTKAASLAETWEDSAQSLSDPLVFAVRHFCLVWDLHSRQGLSVQLLYSPQRFICCETFLFLFSSISNYCRYFVFHLFFSGFTEAHASLHKQSTFRICLYSILWLFNCWKGNQIIEMLCNAYWTT